MFDKKKIWLPVVALFMLCLLSTGCSKNEVVDPHKGHSGMFEKNGGGDDDCETGYISDGGDEESDSERNNKQPVP